MKTTCMRGLDVICATHSHALVGVASAVTDWDKSATYEQGDTVRYWGNWYRAQRHIDSSWWGNGAPDKSDSWTVAAPSTVLGAYDIAASQRAMTGVKKVPVGVAVAMLKGGLGAINYARTIAEQHSLPGSTTRDNVYWKLQWHKDTLKPLLSMPNLIYDSGADLKKWVMQAFIEANAVEEGAAYMDQAWDDMWREIAAAIAALPKEIAQTITDVAKPLVKAAAWTYWIAIGAAVMVLGVVATGVGVGVKQRVAGR